MYTGRATSLSLPDDEGSDDTRGVLTDAYRIV